MSLFVPDRYFARVSSIDVNADILARGYNGVLLDIDNTLLSRADHLVPSDVLAWLACLERAGVRACLLSNNWHAHVHDLARELGLPLVAKACKPLPHGFLAAAHRLRVSRRRIVMIGDQLSTDVVGAHAVGMGAYLVCPLAEEDLKHTQAVRVIEGLFIGDRQPEGAHACETSHS